MKRNSRSTSELSVACLRPRLTGALPPAAAAVRQIPPDHHGPVEQPWHPGGRPAAVCGGGLRRGQLREFADAERGDSAGMVRPEGPSPTHVTTQPRLPDMSTGWGENAVQQAHREARTKW